MRSGCCVETKEAVLVTLACEVIIDRYWNLSRANVPFDSKEYSSEDDNQNVDREIHVEGVELVGLKSWTSHY